MMTIRDESGCDKAAGEMLIKRYKITVRCEG